MEEKFLGEERRKNINMTDYVGDEKRITDLSERMRKLEDRYIEMNTTVTKSNTVMDRFESTMSRIQSTLDKFGDTIASLDKTLSSVQVELQHNANEISEMKLGLKNIETKVEVIDNKSKVDTIKIISNNWWGIVTAASVLIILISLGKQVWEYYLSKMMTTIPIITPFVK
jgi:chromosome segregation ATPase